MSAVEIEDVIVDEANAVAPTVTDDVGEPEAVRGCTSTGLKPGTSVDAGEWASSRSN